ncbi:hypothetical protein HJFPF1_09561 [Paramyrothecium foliicola]|nr:hypothetical protein HJFPF1_09561 [Paramyrothecium foliicola]
MAFSKSYKEQQPLALFRKYGNALKEVRNCLEAGSKHDTIDIICAIYMILLAWIGRQSEQTISHEEGLARLVETLVSHGPQNEFEGRVLSAISIPVIFGIFTNPSIKLSPKFWAVAEMLAAPLPAGPQPPTSAQTQTPFPSLHFSVIGKLPDHLHYPELYLTEMRYTYARVKADLPKFASSLVNLENRPNQEELTRARARRDYEAAYSMALAIALATNQILQAADPADQSLQRELLGLVDQIIGLAEDASKYIPIGSGFIVGPLSIACASVDDQTMKSYMKTLLGQFFGAFKGEDWSKLADWWYYKFMDIRCRLGKPRPTDDPVKAAKEIATPISCVQCSASHNYIEVGSVILPINGAATCAPTKIAPEEKRNPSIPPTKDKQSGYMFFV